VNHDAPLGWNPDASLFVVDVVDIVSVGRHDSIALDDLPDNVDLIG
jgi:hypothetical protein